MTKIIASPRKVAESSDPAYALVGDGMSMKLLRWSWWKRYSKELFKFVKDRRLSVSWGL